MILNMNTPFSIILCLNFEEPNFIKFLDRVISIEKTSKSIERANYCSQIVISIIVWADNFVN